MTNLNATPNPLPINRRHALQTGAIAVGSVLSDSGSATEPKARIKIGQIGMGHAHTSNLAVYRNSPDYEVGGVLGRPQTVASFNRHSASWTTVLWATCSRC